MRSLVLSLSLLGGALHAQVCTRPFIETSGAPLAFEQQVEVVYSDGYAVDGTLIYPSVPPPTCGWPLVVYVHRLGQNRLEDLGLCTSLADHGYAVWTYDVRGQSSGLLKPGNAALPTRGTTLWGAVERYDLAEQIQFVAAHVPWQGIVDATRVAVMGPSQGGAHAWAAAAMSGQSFTVPGRGTIVFPAIRCTIAADYVAESVFDWLRGGQLWGSWFVDQITDDIVHPGYELDAQFWLTAANAFRNQDPASLLTAWAAENRRTDASLQLATVPVLYSHAYHDLIDSPLPALQIVEGMAAPTKVLLSTIGHNTPQNTLERSFRDRMFLRWLHRWLWDEANEVELESPFVQAEMPIDPLLRNDPNHLWSRRHGTNPLQSATATRLWLHDDFGLRETEPLQTQTPAAIDQLVVDPNFTPAFYLASASNRQLVDVLTAIPLSEQVFTMDPLLQEVEIAQSPRLHLQITPDRAHWMLAALFTAQENGGNEVMLSCTGVGRDASAPGLAELVEFQLPPVAMRLPAGTVLRLRLRNLWLREAPMTRLLETAPLFHDFHLLIGRGTIADGSWLDLPLTPTRPALVASTQFLEIATVDPVHFELRGGVARAGFPYLLTASNSGQMPGTHYLNAVIPIEVDWLTGIVTVSAFTPQFLGFLSDLDANGVAHPVMDLSMFAPLHPAFIGFRLTFAAFVWDGAGTFSGAASNPVDVFVR